MNKDNDLKKDPQYDSSSLRKRIDDITKAVRDDTEELGLSQAKTLPFIPVTGSDQNHKYDHNKSPKPY